MARRGTKAEASTAASYRRKTSEYTPEFTNVLGILVGRVPSSVKMYPGRVQQVFGSDRDYVEINVDC